jgi:hypothetical protein
MKPSVKVNLVTAILSGPLLLLALFPAPLTASTLTIAWNPNIEADLAGYIVHYGLQSRNYDSVINVGNVTEYTITGLEPAARYYLAVTAYDFAGNESGFSAEISDITESPSNPFWVHEAEGGKFFGAFEIGSDPAASGGQYVHVPNGSGNRYGGPDEAHKVEYSFDVPTAGWYRIKGWVYGSNDWDDSFWVTVNGSPSGGYLWDTLQNTSYQSDYVNDRGGDDPVEVWLEAGTNTVTIYLRENGTSLDTIELEPVR